MEASAVISNLDDKLVVVDRQLELDLATIGVSGGSFIAGLVAGVVGAAIGTYGGAEIRSRMAAGFGRDTPAAFIEDVGAIVLGLIVIGAHR